MTTFLIFGGGFAAGIVACCAAWLACDRAARRTIIEQDRRARQEAAKRFKRTTRLNPNPKN